LTARSLPAAPVVWFLRVVPELLNPRLDRMSPLDALSSPIPAAPSVSLVRTSRYSFGDCWMMLATTPGSFFSGVHLVDLGPNILEGIGGADVDSLAVDQKGAFHAQCRGFG